MSENSLIKYNGVAAHGRPSPASGSARLIPPAMTLEEIKSKHIEDIKIQAIEFYMSKTNVFAGDPPMKRWRSCVQMVVECWLILGPQKHNQATRTIYL